MEREYRETLQRIILYRKSCHVSQKRMGDFLGITQSQYSKMELGRLDIPFWVVKVWAHIGWDIDYFVTGRIRQDTDTGFRGLFGSHTYGDEPEVLRIILLAVYAAEETEHMFCNERRALEQLMKEPGKDVLFCSARQLNGMSQEVMSQCLGIGLRKYRRMERGLERPDFRTLVLLYKVSSYIPWLFIDYEEGRCRMAQYIWTALDEVSQNKIRTFIEVSCTAYEKNGKTE